MATWIDGMYLEGNLTVRKGVFLASCIIMK
jgi:hypothetical protein